MSLAAQAQRRRKSVPTEIVVAVAAPQQRPHRREEWIEMVAIPWLGPTPAREPQREPRVERFDAPRVRPAALAEQVLRAGRVLRAAEEPAGEWRAQRDIGAQLCAVRAVEAGRRRPAEAQLAMVAAR